MANRITVTADYTIPEKSIPFYESARRPDRGDIAFPPTTIWHDMATGDMWYYAGIFDAVPEWRKFAADADAREREIRLSIIDVLPKNWFKRFILKWLFGIK